MNFIKNVKGIVMSDAAKDYLPEMVKNAIGALTGDPLSALEMIKNVKSFPAAVRDGIFMECLQIFLLNSCEYDTENQEFVDKNLSAFVIALAEAGPNEATGYEGDPERLTEYAKRLIKLIDDCGTIQKSYYIACLARAVRAKYITASQFFKFSHCIRSLTEEDLLFLKNHIGKEVISTDDEYIDDYRALGLMKDVDGGFAYTERAFKVVKYALDYEGNLELPDSYPERFTPITAQGISDEAIEALFNERASEIVDQAAEKATLKWETI